MNSDPAKASQEAAAKVFASQWWAQRWIDVLESFGWTQRLARGRNYARGGNVLAMEFQGSKVKAKVQGTAPTPYDVTLFLDRFSDEQWQEVIETLAGRAIFAAKLLAGEMPQNIEEAFIASGLSLFPFNKWDIHSQCSCPDSANPCKHIAAVYYLMGERFDQDPFVLFALRGRSRTQILQRLRELRGSGTTAPSESAATESTAPPVPPLKAQGFWQLAGDLDPSLVAILPPPSQETVLDVLGPPPIEGAEPVVNYFKGTYAQVRNWAMAAALGAE
ncbi:MAG: SWIM zinc finger family protein [Aphanocapsa lilacina HA4352-LM1]|jgi:uncharacterized Zn finger protein|nr:SWIM zinc finger family protein [Aphanocapsa lilacina HA4352-LM1]